VLEDWRPHAVWIAGVPRLVSHRPLIAEAELHREARRVAEALWKRIA
jgi:hypothetical protein